MSDIDHAFLVLHLRWALMALGLIYLITESAIFVLVRVWFAKGSPFRTTLIYCPACTGFWCGMAVAGLDYWPFDYGDDYISRLWEYLESAVAGMVLGAIWGTVRRSLAYEIEAELRGELSSIGQTDDTTQEIEDE